MKINKESFLKVLNTVAPALSEKAMIEGTDRFIFTGNKIVTYNDRICIFVPFKFDWKCSLPAKELKGIISAIKEDEIDFDLVDGKMTMNKVNSIENIYSLKCHHCRAMMLILNNGLYQGPNIYPEIITSSID